ncbi:hypothetical protein [Ruegeria sp. HKCCSP335]|uniref:hypothetical protein n=1 Tax=Ruegeria sp. HKCCSP335 TaxID=2794833 RepID=UPI001AE74E3D|nr:hypothetical protein [Ruegeria sp. HKCCSP335]
MTNSRTIGQLLQAISLTLIIMVSEGWPQARAQSLTEPDDLLADALESLVVLNEETEHETRIALLNRAISTLKYILERYPDSPVAQQIEGAGVEILSGNSVSRVTVASLKSRLKTLQPIEGTIADPDNDVSIAALILEMINKLPKDRPPTRDENPSAELDAVQKAIDEVFRLDPFGEIANHLLTSGLEVLNVGPVRFVDLVNIRVNSDVSFEELYSSEKLLLAELFIVHPFRPNVNAWNNDLNSCLVLERPSLAAERLDEDSPYEAMALASYHGIRNDVLRFGGFFREPPTASEVREEQLLDGITRYSILLQDPSAANIRQAMGQSGNERRHAEDQEIKALRSQVMAKHGQSILAATAFVEDVGLAIGNSESEVQSNVGKICSAILSEVWQKAPQGGDNEVSVADKKNISLAISRCWNIGSLSTNALSVTVKVSFEVDNQNRPIAETIHGIGLREGHSETGKAFEQAFQAASRAILRCGANGLPIPENGPTRLEVVFDPDTMRVTPDPND